MCKKSALPVVWVSLARVANVVSRVCLDPLALPARKARRVNLVRTGWTGVIMTILGLSAV